MSAKKSIRRSPRAKPEDIRVVVAIPMERVINQQAFWSFIRIAQQGAPFFSLAYTRCDIARNSFAQDLLNSDHTHLLMLDSDHVHPPDIIQRLVRWVLEDSRRLVVGGLNFRRGEPYDACAYLKDDDGTIYTLTEWQDDLIECYLLGTGSILISRKVFERIPGPWFTYDYKQWPDNYPGVDVSFCHRCREHNIGLYCDTTTTSPHLVDSIVDQSTFRYWLEREK